jgi:hypothetical protein
MKCPRDGAETARSVEEGGVPVETCTRCGGVWLDKGELETILEAHRKVVRGEDPPDDPVRGAYRVAEERGDGARACPKCGTEMERREYAMTSQVLIDTCPRGHGMWLDGGELDEIERFYDEEKAEADRAPGLVLGLLRLLGM